MPPEGYETVTLPEEMVEQLDEMAESRRKAISYLMGLDTGDETAAGVATIADAVAARVNDPSDMDGVESSLQAIEERTGRMEQTLEELAEGRR